MLIEIALQEDIGTGDITTAAVVGTEAAGQGTIGAKEEMVIAGLEIARRVFLTVDHHLVWERYVEDGAAAYLRLAEHLGGERSLSGEAFNFSNERPANVLEIAQHILRLMGREDLTPVVQNQASGEIGHQYLDATKAKERLGWTPQFDLQAGLRRTIDWYRHFFDAKGPA